MAMPQRDDPPALLRATADKLRKSSGWMRCLNTPVPWPWEREQESGVGGSQWNESDKRNHEGTVQLRFDSNAENRCTLAEAEVLSNNKDVKWKRF